MTVRINCQRCDGCRRAKEALCARVCPGGLFSKDAAGKASIRTPEDCWDCAACVKECPRDALSLFLPVEAGGRGSTLGARKKNGGLQWTLTDRRGNVETIFTAGEKVM